MIIKKILLILMLAAIVDDMSVYFYVVYVAHDLSGTPLQALEILFFAFSFWLIKRNKVLGAVLCIVLSLIGLWTVYQVDGSFFSLASLHFAPQIFFRNALEILSIVVSVLYMGLKIFGGKKHVSH
ncbi:MAG: hypothetical protein NTV32_05190 [Gammaproteobacteria bacterium]|nr:hypothetical protein [Gammaproteobacteria bacterium]